MSRGKFTSGSRQLKVPHDAPQRSPSHASLAKFCGFIILVFFIMASYLLSGERKTLLEDLSESTLRDLVRSIGTKVTFRARRVPAVSELHDFDPHMFSVIPPHFLPNVKNPCWYEELRGNVSADPYGSNLFGRLSSNMRIAFECLSATFKKQLILRDGKLQRLRCLPYFYIIGQPKCGTTDLYERLRLHPDVHLTPPKEPHWWSRKRFGIIRPGDPPLTRFPLDHYLDLFEPVAQRIQHRLLGNSSISSSIITGEASASTLWDNLAWLYLHDISREAEPPSLVQDFIQAVQPDARLIAILRDPVERLYSDYLYFGTSNESALDFHQKVCESLRLFDACLRDAGLRACVYSGALYNAMSVRLHVGLYVVFILDWLSVFSRDQLLVLRLEDHAANLTHSMNRVFHFLQLGPVSEQTERLISRRPVANTRDPSDRKLGPMKPVTRELLRQFYAPFNQKLSAVLQDESFMW
ncbi:carbohydrate sulfotransferase 15-like [Megalobrama amblycephala]|uniref:carbohydrate sulfotransferase 15-like n=1 Tax=Megalobrama amblycephala TaxID=75352 RepID=UPI0020141B4C|nr:carbohydrate sulfotransferase 15-like [Megalobrama amblycephala]XP_048026798.1 carbohydrate sulfotransferase 15-like [Megalobrama amblycephala]